MYFTLRGPEKTQLTNSHKLPQTALVTATDTLTITEFATELIYTQKMMALLKSELDVRDGELSESFIRWVLTQPVIYDGRITTSVIERFKPITKEALQKVIRNIVRRSVAAIDEGVTSSDNEKPIEDVSTEDSGENIAQDSGDSLNQPSSNKKGIVTTEEELESFAIIKHQFENSPLCNALIYDPSLKKECPIEISYKDTISYFNIYFNKPSWWNLRLSLDSRIKWVGIDIDPDKGRELVPPGFEILKPQSVAQFRVKIDEIEELKALSPVIFAAFEKTIQDREDGRIEDERTRLAS